METYILYIIKIGFSEKRESDSRFLDYKLHEPFFRKKQHVTCIQFTYSIYFRCFLLDCKYALYTNAKTNFSHVVAKLELSNKRFRYFVEFSSTRIRI